MPKEPTISAAEALEWEETLGRLRPDAPTAAQAGSAIEVRSFNVAGATDGLYLRLRTSKGGADLFLNAVVATQLADVIRQVGTACLWQNTDDGSVIVSDPQNLAWTGRKI